MNIKDKVYNSVYSPVYILIWSIIDMFGDSSWLVFNSVYTVNKELLKDGVYDYEY